MEENIVFAVDSHDNGITIGRVPRGDFSVPSLVLRAHADTRARSMIRTRYSFGNENPLWEFERALMKLSRQGILSRALLVFGVSSDPFYPFEGRFDCSMKALALCERYLPAKIVIQTRSPLMVLSLPLLKRLVERVSVTFPIETPRMTNITKYLPDTPALPERLSAMNTLRKLGVHVTAQAFPILPYGDWIEDAEQFADLLASHSDSIITAPLLSELELRQKRVKKTMLLEALARDRQFRYLRPDTDQKLREVLNKKYASKMVSPYELHAAPRQLRWQEILSA